MFEYVFACVCMWVGVCGCVYVEICINIFMYLLVRVCLVCMHACVYSYVNK